MKGFQTNFFFDKNSGFESKNSFTIGVGNYFPFLFSNMKIKKSAHVLIACMGYIFLNLIEMLHIPNANMPRVIRPSSSFLCWLKQYLNIFSSRNCISTNLLSPNFRQLKPLTTVGVITYINSNAIHLPPSPYSVIP